MGRIDVKGKNALVTGGTRRIGEAVSRKLASAGSNVVLHYRSPESESDTRELAGELSSTGVNAWVVGGDLSTQAGVEGFFSDVRRISGDVDILVNNASVFKEDGVMDFEPADLYEHVDINALAPLMLSRELAKGGREAVIVNLLDARITDYDARHASYHLSKRMLADITAMLAIELAPRVRVNAVAPGLVLPPPGRDESYVESRKRTNLLESRGTPDDVAEAVLFLVLSSFVTGQIVYVDGGRHLKGRVYEVS